MHLKATLNYLSLFCLTGFLLSCDILGSGPCLEGSGSIKKEVRNVVAFKGVDMRIAGNVVITEGKAPEVSLESYSNLLKEIKTEVVNQTLVIRSESCLEYSNEEATVYITMPDIEHVELKSSGHVRVQAVPSSQKLRVGLSGSGTIHYLGSIARINLLHSGSGQITLEGFANHLETTLSGSGKIEGYFMNADTAKVLSSGSGIQQIWVNGTFDATVTGSGNIYYRGNPASISTYVTGSGKVVNGN
ncbi:head GIN domain-containing protein [Rufibacter immobilis]|nr:head GIN domain-containing protein [Rufibacter immobilis]